MDTLNTGFRLLPVVAELLFAAQRLLPFAQGGCMPLETVEWGVDGAIREGGKPGHTQVDADRTALWQGLLNLSLRLDAYEPLATAEADRGILHRAEHRTAVAVTQPTELGQEKARVHLVELDLL